MNMTIGGHHCTVTTSFHAISVVIHIPTFLDVVVQPDGRSSRKCVGRWIMGISRRA